MSALDRRGSAGKPFNARGGRGRDARSGYTTRKRGRHKDQVHRFPTSTGGGRGGFEVSRRASVPARGTGARQPPCWTTRGKERTLDTRATGPRTGRPHGAKAGTGRTKAKSPACGPRAEGEPIRPSDTRTTFEAGRVWPGPLLGGSRGGRGKEGRTRPTPVLVRAWLHRGPGPSSGGRHGKDGIRKPGRQGIYYTQRARPGEGSRAGGPRPEDRAGDT